MLDITRYAVKDAFDNLPLDKRIWESIQDWDLPRAFRTFLWKAMHGAHKLGRFWEIILNFKHWTKCIDCGEEDNLKHIMLWCPESGHRSIWPLVKTLWDKKKEWKPSMARDAKHRSNTESRDGKIHTREKIPHWRWPSFQIPNSRIDNADLGD